MKELARMLGETLKAIFGDEPNVSEDAVLIGLQTKHGLTVMNFDLSETPTGRCETMISFSFMQDKDRPFDLSHLPDTALRLFCSNMQEHLGWGTLGRATFTDGARELALYRYIYLTEAQVTLADDNASIGTENALVSTLHELLVEFDQTVPIVKQLASGKLTDFSLIKDLVTPADIRVC